MSPVSSVSTNADVTSTATDGAPANSADTRALRALLRDIAATAPVRAPSLLDSIDLRDL